MMQQEVTKREKLVRWVKRLGFWGFMFFLVKGLLWLVFGYWLIKK